MHEWKAAARKTTQSCVTRNLHRAFQPKKVFWCRPASVFVCRVEWNYRVLPFPPAWGLFVRTSRYNLSRWSLTDLTVTDKPYLRPSLCVFAGIFSPAPHKCAHKRKGAWIVMTHRKCVLFCCTGALSDLIDVLFFLIWPKIVNGVAL